VILDLHDALHECMGVVTVPFAVLTQELAGFGRSTVRDQIAHVFSAETAWVSALRMLPELRRFDAATLRSTDDIRKAQREAMGGTRAYLDSISDDQLNSKLGRYHPDWTSPHRTPGFILVHVVTHGCRAGVFGLPKS
jgi:uncharacterized damage-inducible protein DinB